MLQKLPVVLGLLGIWNSTFLKLNNRAILPYSQALLRFAAHIQQVDMESNGKRVDRNGEKLLLPSGEVNFGEPGTNSQHSFYQLLHQGSSIVPCDFIGSIHSQHPIDLTNLNDDNITVSNHDELMSNFFAQPDALAIGKNENDLRKEGVAEDLIPHKVFDGNRMSNVLLFPRFDAFYIGSLLSLYEHRTAVQGFIWGINSFDQFGVELGKVLGKRVRKVFESGEITQGEFNSATEANLKHYLENKSKK